VVLTTFPLLSPVLQMDYSFFLRPRSVTVLAFRGVTLTLSLLMYIYGAPGKDKNFNVVYIYGPTFGNAKRRLFVIAAQCFNTESMQKVILWHSCM
jgi:hypothetical protein